RRVPDAGHHRPRARTLDHARRPHGGRPRRRRGRAPGPGGSGALPRRRPPGARLRLAVTRRPGRPHRAQAPGVRTVVRDRTLHRQPARPPTLTDHPLRIGVACFSTFGGSGVIAAEVATALARRGHAVHVFSDERPTRLTAEPGGPIFHPVGSPAYPQLRHSLYSLALA